MEEYYNIALLIPVLIGPFSEVLKPVMFTLSKGADSCQLQY